MTSPTAKYTFATRLAHIGLALATIFQLATSLVMQHPGRTRPGDFYYGLHEYGGLAAMAFAFLFWLAITTRNTGTSWGQLIPWFSASRRSAFIQDLSLHARALTSLRLPTHHNDSPLASATHGLGLLLLTYMAASGTVYYVTRLLGVPRNEPVHLLMEIHATLGNVVWAYLIAHAVLAIIHHIRQDQAMTAMWSLRR